MLFHFLCPYCICTPANGHQSLHSLTILKTLYRKNLFPVPKPQIEKSPTDKPVENVDKEGTENVPKSSKPLRLFISPQFWSAISPDGVDRLLPLVLWISMQYLGNTPVSICFDVCSRSLICSHSSTYVHSTTNDTV